MALGDWMKAAASKATAKIDETLKAASERTAGPDAPPLNTAAIGNWVKSTAAKAAEKIDEGFKTATEPVDKEAAPLGTDSLGLWMKNAATKVAARVEQSFKDVAAEADERRKAYEAERAAEAESQRRGAALHKRLEERFRTVHFPRMPDAMKKDYPNAPNLREDLWDLWEDILREWPDPPADDVERQRREDIYWQRELSHCVLKNEAGDVRLRPKQEVIDEWFGLEKWHFRRYYAATGIVQRSVFSHEWIKHWEIKDKYRKRKSWKTGNANDRAAMEECNRAHEYIDAFVQNTIPQHKEKWGNWYFFHVEQAYKKTVAPPPRAFSKPSDDL